jgi:hypothetical protein
MTLTTKVLKGSPEYAVMDGSVEVARAHCVNVRAGLFTLVVDGRWAGVAPEAVVVAKPRGMVVP